MLLKSSFFKNSLLLCSWSLFNDYAYIINKSINLKKIKVYIKLSYFIS